MNESDYRGGWLITPKLRAAELAIKWFRPPGGYLYIRETVLTEPDRQREILPLGELEGCEILGIAECDPHKLGPRRVWFLSHEPGYLDGIALPPRVNTLYFGFIVAVDPKETTVRAREYSPLGFSPREITAAEIAEATKHRDNALAFWAANDAENERRLAVRRAREAQRRAEAQRNPYREKANQLDD